MQLPQDLQHFPKATLLVLSDRVTTKFWLLGGDTMEALDGVSLAHEHKEDHEGSYLSSDGSHTGSAESGNEDDERFHKFLHLIVERIDTLVREQKIMHVHLVMPAEIDHAISSHLSQDVVSKLGKHVHHDLMQENPLEIIKRVLSA